MGQLRLGGDNTHYRTSSWSSDGDSALSQTPDNRCADGHLDLHDSTQLHAGLNPYPAEVFSADCAFDDVPNLTIHRYCRGTIPVGGGDTWRDI